MDSFNGMTALNMKDIGKRKQDGQGIYHTTYRKNERVNGLTEKE